MEEEEASQKANKWFLCPKMNFKENDNAQFAADLLSYLPS